MNRSSTIPFCTTYTYDTASAVNEEDMPTIEKIYHIEQQVIKELVARQSCVIVGRLANYILRDHKNSLHIFVNADMETKIKNVSIIDKLPPDEARKDDH